MNGPAGTFRVAYNACSAQFFESLPAPVRNGILSLQMGIHNAVLRSCPRAVGTSGFRCHCENTRCHGVPHSLHTLGAARDYALCDGFPNVLPGLRILKEADHFHVEIA